MNTRSAKTFLMVLICAGITLLFHALIRYYGSDHIHDYNKLLKFYIANQDKQKSERETLSVKPYDRLQAVMTSTLLEDDSTHSNNEEANSPKFITSLINTLSDNSGVAGASHLSRLYKDSNLIRTPQSETVLEVLGNDIRGTFIECGAYDGETGSNSLELELFHGWTGLLIEPNPFYYAQVLGKNRNVQTLNTCLSPSQTLTVLDMEIYGCAQRCKMRSEKRYTSVKVPCIPLPSILRAFNITQVDYFSLDVEGAEYDVLKTIPFLEFDIKTLSVEYKHDDVGKDEIVRFMKEKGYVMHRDLHDKTIKRSKYVNDVFFVKREYLE